MSAACKSCDAPVVWAVTGAKRCLIPLDAAPTADGNIELVDGYAKTWGTAHTWPDGVDRYTAHFATCPHANDHRRNR